MISENRPGLGIKLAAAVALIVIVGLLSLIVAALLM